jgi:hypothetical protein
MKCFKKWINVLPYRLYMHVERERERETYDTKFTWEIGGRGEWGGAGWERGTICIDEYDTRATEKSFSANTYRELIYIYIRTHTYHIKGRSTHTELIEKKKIKFLFQPPQRRKLQNKDVPEWWRGIQKEKQIQECHLFLLFQQLKKKCWLTIIATKYMYVGNFVCVSKY